MNNKIIIFWFIINIAFGIALFPHKPKDDKLIETTIEAELLNLRVMINELMDRE